MKIWTKGHTNDHRNAQRLAIIADQMEQENLVSKQETDLSYTIEKETGIIWESFAEPSISSNFLVFK